MIPAQRDLARTGILAGRGAGGGFARIAGVALRPLPGIVDHGADHADAALVEGDGVAEHVAEIDVGQTGVLGRGIGRDELDPEQVADILVKDADIEAEQAADRLLVAELVLHRALGLDVRIAEYAVADTARLQIIEDIVIRVGKNLAQGRHLVKVAISDKERGAGGDRIGDAQARREGKLGFGIGGHRGRGAGDGVGRIGQITRQGGARIEIFEAGSGADHQVAPLDLVLAVGDQGDRVVLGDAGIVRRLVDVPHQDRAAGVDQIAG